MSLQKLLRSDDLKVNTCEHFLMELTWVEGQSLSELELKKIIELDNEIPRMFDPTWKPTKSMAERLEQFKKFNQNDFFRVIYENNEIISFHIIRGSKNHIAYVETLWVRPSHQKRGLAKELKALGVAWAKAKGYESLQTAVHIKNERMQNFNIQSGYKPLSTVFVLNLKD